MNACDVVGRVVDGELFCADCGPEDADPVFCGSETDCPNHCPECGERIDETLTTDGVNYVRGAVAEAINKGALDSVALTEWADLALDWTVVERVKLRATRNARRIAIGWPGLQLPFGS